jgi:CheY-like chemotaxis protein
VVEDSADDVELLLIAAKTAPEAVSFRIVGDGETAVAYLAGEGQYGDRNAHPLPDLVLLDLGLPGMDGFAVLDWIRQHPKFSALRVFVWTDSGDPGTLDRALRIGANRCAAGWPDWCAASRRRFRTASRRITCERQAQSARSRIPANSSGVSVIGFAFMLLAWEAISTNPLVCSRLRP